MGVVVAQQRGDTFALKQELPIDWFRKRPEELTPGQFVEVTRLLLGDDSSNNNNNSSSSSNSNMENDDGSNESHSNSNNNSSNNNNETDLGRKVWRKLKHGV